MKPSDTQHMFAQRRGQGLGKYRCAVLGTLCGANGDSARAKVQVFHPQGRALTHAKPCPIKKLRHQVCGALHASEHALHFFDRQDDGDSVWMLNPFQTRDLSEGALKDMLIEEHNGAKRLGLRRGGNLAPHREVVKECGNFGCTHLARMTLMVKQNELAAPEAIACQSSGAVMTPATNDRKLIEQSRSRG